MKISYSFHLGSKGNTISSKTHLKKVYDHNSRNYKDSNKIKRGEIIQIVGTKNIYADVKKLYGDEFSGSVEKFNNAKGRKSRDKIDDYFEKIADDKQKSIAEEIIIGFGKKEFWEELSFDNKEMTGVFEKQIEEFQNLYPNFKIANATVHYDEESPHVHIVGVPIKYGASRGLENQVSKSSVFSRESLTAGQDKLREVFIEDIKKIKIKDNTGKNIANDLELNEKEKGRNFNYSLEDYKKMKDEEKKLKKQKAEQDKRDKTLDQRESGIANEVEKQVAEQLKLQQLELNNEITQYKEKTKDIDQAVNKRAETIVSDYVEVLKMAETEVASKDRKVVAMSKEFADIPVIKRREGLTGKSIPTYAVKDIIPVFNSMIDYFNEVHKKIVLVTPIVEENKTLKEQNQKNKDYDPLKKEYDNLKSAVEKMYTDQIEEVYVGYSSRTNTENETKTKVNKVKEVFKEVLKPVIMNYWEDKVLNKLGLTEVFKKKKVVVEEKEPNVYVRTKYEPTPIYNTKVGDDNDVEWEYDSDLYEEMEREKEAELDDEYTR